MQKRMRILGVAFGIGIFFSLCFASNSSATENYLESFSVLAGGPIVPTAWGWTDYHPTFKLGWLGLPLMPAHCIRPSTPTACITIIGTILWFFSGFSCFFWGISS
jgi:hypothetical protein